MRNEHLYKLHQFVGPAPIIRKVGALRAGMEQTPVVWNGRFLMVESVHANERCNYQHMQVRDLITDEVVSAPFGEKHYFASAYAEGDTLYAFATNCYDDRPMTMYESEDESAWHDSRGGHSVRMYKTTDLIHWEEKDVITCRDKRLWNTSVCKGDGEYVMAIEVRFNEGCDDDNPHIGVPFTTFFARSTDMENWEMMDDEYSYTPTRYNACPALRYTDGYYYMICLEALPAVRYAPYIYRTKDFLDWEVGFHNPFMMYDDGDRKVKEGHTIPEDRMEKLLYGLNINCSDLDLCEYEGKTHIYYANGDQMTYSFLCEAIYDGPLDQLLKSFFSER